MHIEQIFAKLRKGEVAHRDGWNGSPHSIGLKDGRLTSFDSDGTPSAYAFTDADVTAKDWKDGAP